MSRSIHISLMLLLCIPFAKADGVGFTLGQPQMSGRDCPAGSVSAVVSDDGSAISLLFSKFSVLFPAQSTALAASSMCSFIIPVSVSSGFNLQAVSIDYRGFVQIPANMQGNLATTGTIAERADRTKMLSSFFSKDSGDFSLSQQVGQDLGPRCTHPTQIRINTILSIVKGRAHPKDDATIVLDSADIGGGADLSLKVKLVPCT